MKGKLSSRYHFKRVHHLVTLYALFRCNRFEHCNGFLRNSSTGHYLLETNPEDANCVAVAQRIINNRVEMAYVDATTVWLFIIYCVILGQTGSRLTKALYGAYAFGCDGQSMAVGEQSPFRVSLTH